MDTCGFSIESVGQHHDVIRFLDDRIYEHNSSSIHRDDGSLFSKVIRDQNGAIIAGISGWTWAMASEINLLWVKDEYRRIGLGRLLLQAAEVEARQKGCRAILVRSYSFQAPFFYEKNGYGVAYILDDFPHGHTYYTLIKRL
ncbi:MAG: GNAT family N-acetyltransferase [Chitinivibrionales bacterium]|nr:GNAT family N-acetyltransferase [Chitinivibrionales bacterium]